MTHIHSFPPIISKQSKLIILGSMPGKASLEAQQYYAHPRNAFWRIVGHILQFDTDLSYDERSEIIQQSPIAIWDTLKTCTRSSSLDSDIVESSIVPNEFDSLLREYPQVKHLFFNGSKSEQVFKKYVAPNLNNIEQIQTMIRLPSTSPAHAAMRFEEKLKHWHEAFAEVLD